MSKLGETEPVNPGSVNSERKKEEVAIKATTSNGATYDSIKDPVKDAKLTEAQRTYGSISESAGSLPDHGPTVKDRSQYPDTRPIRHVLHPSEVDALVACARHHLKRAIIFIALGMGTTAGALLALTNALFDSTGNKSLFTGTSAAAASVLMAAWKLYFGPLSDNYGRKPFIVMACAAHTFNAILLAAWPTLIAVIITTVITSIFCVTFLLQTIVTDLSHQTHAEIAGRLGKYMALAVVLILASLYVGSLIPTWAAFAAAATFWGTAMLYVMWFFPETLPLSIYYEWAIIQEEAEERLRVRAAEAGLGGQGDPEGDVEAYRDYLDHKYDLLNTGSFQNDTTASARLPRSEKVAKISRESGIDTHMEEKSPIFSYNPLKTLRILLWTETTRTLTISWFFRDIGVSAVIAIFVAYTDEVYNWGTGEQGRFTLIVGFFVGFSNGIVGYFVRTYGSGWVVLGGSITTLVGFVLMTASFNDVLFQVAGFPMIPLGIGWTTALSSIFAIEIPRSQQATMQSAIAAVLDIGSAVGAAIATAIFVLVGDDPMLFYAPQALFVFADVMLLFSVAFAYKAVYLDGNPDMAIEDETTLKYVPFALVEAFTKGIVESYKQDEDTTGHILDTPPEGDEEGGGGADLTEPNNVTKSEQDLLLRKDNKSPETTTSDAEKSQFC